MRARVPRRRGDLRASLVRRAPSLRVVGPPPPLLHRFTRGRSTPESPAPSTFVSPRRSIPHMVEQAQPAAQFERGWFSRAAAWVKAHRREVTGYLVWGAMGVVVGVPEVWAAADTHAPWRTISG